MELKDIYALYLQHPNVCTDTRTISEGCIFFCLKGENFDGNLFADEAIEKGAAYVMSDNPENAHNANCIIVDNVLQTLQALALYHRRQLNVPILSITGTNGKTTTKELVTAVLARKYKVYATKGNFNNQIGVPLTLLSFPTDIEIGVVEMGASHKGDIAELCAIAEPDFGIITNIGRAHLEGFGDIEGVAHTKLELFESVRKKNGHLFINTANQWLAEYKNNTKHTTYGTTSDATIEVHIAESNPYLKVLYEGQTISTRLVGEYNLENVGAAICVGKHFDVPFEDIKQALEDYCPTNHRSQVMETQTNTLIIDAYNANPSSMKQAIINFAKLTLQPTRVLMLGDMLELGSTSIDEHVAILQTALQCGLSHLFLVGKEFGKAAEQLGVQANCFANVDELKAYVEQHAIQHSLILLKGSHSMHMEKMVEVL